MVKICLKLLVGGGHQQYVHLFMKPSENEINIGNITAIRGSVIYGYF